MCFTSYMRAVTNSNNRYSAYNGFIIAHELDNVNRFVVIIHSLSRKSFDASQSAVTYSNNKNAHRVDAGFFGSCSVGGTG